MECPGVQHARGRNNCAQLVSDPTAALEIIPLPTYTSTLLLSALGIVLHSSFVIKLCGENKTGENKMTGHQQSQASTLSATLIAKGGANLWSLGDV
jgi:hypothetical protein